MLRIALRPAAASAALYAVAAWGQVAIDVPLQLNGPAPERRIDGLAAPASPASLITLGSAAQGQWHWGVAAVSGPAVSLALTPPITEYRDGLLVRFVAPSDIQGQQTLDVDGLGPLPIVRPDGLLPVVGQVREGTVCELMLAGGNFVLMSAAERGCPPGSLPVNDRYCIDTASKDNQSFTTAVVVCARRGGKLCSWDEYHAACVMLGSQLTGMFNQWEWIDDTSNHTQTVDQAGRTSCNSQRSAGSPPTAVGDTRCCYHPR